MSSNQPYRIYYLYLDGMQQRLDSRAVIFYSTGLRLSV